MQRLLGWLLGLVVAAVAAVAAVDALRADDRPAAPPALVAAPIDARASGTLVYTDDSCALRALTLPRLTPARAASWRSTPGCEFSLSPDGRTAAPPHGRWSTAGRLALCVGPNVVVAGPTREAEPWLVDGCQPAWRPDDYLSVVRDGSLVIGGGRVIDHRDLVAAARALPNVSDRPGFAPRVVVQDAAWLSPTRVAVLASLRLGGEPHDRIGAQQMVAIFEEGRLVRARSFFVRGLHRLEASPRGRYVTARPGVLLSRDGRPLPLPATAYAVAWSPDERYAAVAVRAPAPSVVLVQPGRPAPTVRLSLVVRDLAWRRG